MKVEFGVPNPIDKTPNGEVSFKELTSTIYFHKFKGGILPSGGLSGKISSSEMMMVRTSDTVRFTWVDPTGKVIATSKGKYSFIGKYPWEVNKRGYYTCLLNDRYAGKVVFEVL